MQEAAKGCRWQATHTRQVRDGGIGHQTGRQAPSQQAAQRGQTGQAKQTGQETVSEQTKTLQKVTL